MHSQILFNYNKSMKERVKILLKQKNMTAKDLAAKMGISEAALSLSLSGNPTLSRMREIASALEVEVSELLSSSSPTMTCPRCGAKLQITEIKENE